MADPAKPSDTVTEETPSAAEPGSGAADPSAHEIADLKTKLARWQADFANLQRRAAQEVLSARQNADADFAKHMLGVLDHFDMALSVDPAKLHLFDPSTEQRLN